MKKIITLWLALLMLVAIPASAAVFSAGEILELKEDIVTDDLYATGGVIDISGDVDGDVVLAGGDVRIIGNIAEDVLIAGGSVDMLGDAIGDVRIVGGELSVSGRIGDDLVAAGGFVKVLSTTHIGGNAVIAGGAVVMNGTISGDLLIYAEEVMINGIINGNVDLRFTKEVTLGEGTSIGGNLTYSALEEISIPVGVLIGGEIIRTESKLAHLNKEKFKKAAGFLVAGKLLVMLVTGLLAVLVFRRYSERIGEWGVKSFWKNTLVGFVTLVVVPIASIVLFVSLIGLYAGFLLMSTFVLLLLFAKVYAGILVGAFISKWSKGEVVVDWKFAIAGILLLQIIALLPTVGFIVNSVVVLATFGTLLMVVYNKIWLNR